jgi:hypothetical protein
MIKIIIIYPKGMNISVKLNEQRTNLLGMFSMSEYRGKTCFYYVERRNSLKEIVEQDSNI